MIWYINGFSQSYYSSSEGQAEANTGERKLDLKSNQWNFSEYSCRTLQKVMLSDRGQGWKWEMKVLKF